MYLNENDFKKLGNGSTIMTHFMTQLPKVFPLRVKYDPSPLDKDTGVLLAALILVGLYVLIVFELVHRTFAAIIASTMAIGKVKIISSYNFFNLILIFQEFLRQ